MDWATVDIVVVLALVALVFFGFVREWLAPDVVALCAVAVLLATGILATDDVLSVFANGAPITIGALFVLSAALERTGVIDGMGHVVGGLAKRSPVLALVALMGTVVVLSAFINNTAVVVILTPVVIGFAHAIGKPSSKLLIPLSFASIFGGSTTLIGTSTNILVDGVAQRSGLEPFGMFEMTAVGAILALIGMTYLALVGRWLLPSRDSLASLLPSSEDRRFLADVLIPLDSPLVGRKLADAGFTEERGLRVIDMIRDDVSFRWRLDEVELRPGDRVVVRSKVGDMLGLREAGAVAFAGGDAQGEAKGDIRAIEPMGARETVTMEGVVGPQSRLIGRRVADISFRRLYGAYILAIHRQGESLSGNFDNFRLRMGDTVLLEGSAESMRRLFDYQVLVNLVEPRERPLRRGKAPVALGAVALVMALAAFDVLPIAGLALIGATAVVALGCLEPDEAYGAVRWNILMLIFGMLAVGIAMEKTGAAELIAQSVAAVVGGFGPWAVLAAVYLLTTLLTETMSNNAAAVLLTPIAAGLAQQIGADPRPFVVAVMFAASASFATPIGYQTNTFVFNAGGYRFIDFVKVGVPLNLLFWISATLLIPLFWPLG